MSLYARGAMPNDPSSSRACWALWMVVVAFLASFGCAAGVSTAMGGGGACRSSEGCP